MPTKTKDNVKEETNEKDEIKKPKSKKVVFITTITNLTIWTKPEYYEIINGMRMPIKGKKVNFGADRPLVLDSIKDKETIDFLKAHPWFNSTSRGFYEETGD